MQAQGWQLQNIKLTLADLTADKPQFSAEIAQLHLPKPYDGLSLVNIRCVDFSWQNQQLDCKQGRATVNVEQLGRKLSEVKASKRSRLISNHSSGRSHIQASMQKVIAANFSFHIQEQDSWFKLINLRIAGGQLNINLQENAQGWTLQTTGDGIELAQLKKLLPVAANFKAGTAALTATASGSNLSPKKLILSAKLTGVTMDNKDGSLAGESANLNLSLDTNKVNNGWQWRSKINFSNGALYLQPVYLDANKQAINLLADGLWQPDKQRVNLLSLAYQHAGAGELTGNAEINLKTKAIENVNLSATSADLAKFSEVYLKSLLTETPFEGLSLTGQGKADLRLTQQSLTAVNAVFNQLGVKDEKNRLGLEGASGLFNWAKNEMFNEPSTLLWRKLTVANLPVDAGKIHFLAKSSSVRLLDKAVLPLLGGSFAINRFSWVARPEQEPDVYFEGAIKQVSLEQFSKAMDWTPLSGTITGKIPGVQYSNKTISLDGQLLIQAFDGDIKISNLAGSGLFTVLPKFYSDIEVNNLDMDQLTGKFKFGGITGKLSGYVRQLYMENWQPISFYAWFGTPDDDDSRHRISQKAVNNIASIGGGGASDLLSRTVLGAFDTFSYDKIGLGCYLHEGVCQLMGVEAIKGGYAIIKGGGLPRIDVIGYNPRVDWQVLVDRLKRISASDEVIIK